ncbi:MAG: MnhB domain-containing protein [Acidobacteriota bacterium]|nr:MnhB domain-containing protein [Acidobacteriota bacterium]
MKESFLQKNAARIIAPLLFLTSLWMLWRGHNEPGGGFIGGLTAASAVGLWSFVFDRAAAERLLPVSPPGLMVAGVGLAAATALYPLLFDLPPLTGMWLEKPKLGTPLLFDIGVYLTVIGMVTQVLFRLEEE